MGWLAELIGARPAPAATEEALAASPLRRRNAEDHVARFERAVIQAEQALARGETTPERLAELHKWLGYYRQLDALQKGVA